MDNISVDVSVHAPNVNSKIKAKRKTTERAQRPQPKKERKTSQKDADRKMVNGRRLTCENNVSTTLTHKNSINQHGYWFIFFLLANKFFWVFAHCVMCVCPCR